MSKVFMDYKACMADENNVQDILTLPYFKAYLGGLDIITNEEKNIKKPGSFEVHDQFISELGIQFLTNAFENFLKVNGDNLNVDSEQKAQELVLKFLQENGIVFFYDPDVSVETEKFDDLLTYFVTLHPELSSLWFRINLMRRMMHWVYKLTVWQ